MAKEDFEIFWNTHLHMTDSSSSQSADSSILYWHSVKEEAASYPWTRREGTPRQHALAGVARDLMTQVRVATKKMTLSVTVLVNLSPCADCVAELLKAVNLSREKKIKLEISLAFVALHKIRRPSCTQRGHQCGADVCVNESNDNALALRTLSEEGVKVTTFTPPLWQFLQTFVGLGLPPPHPGGFLAGKYHGALCQHRMVEDSLMANELRAILAGLYVTSGGESPDPSTYIVDWTPPKLQPSAKKVTEYRLSYRKVSVKNKESDERQWRIQQSLSPTPTKLVVSAQLTSQRLTELDRDSHYEVTLEAALGAGVICSAKRIFRTDDKAPIASLVSPKKSLVRSNSVSSSSSSVVSPRKSLVRSNSRVSSASVASMRSSNGSAR